MKILVFKKILPVIVLTILCVPIVMSSLLDLKQKSKKAQILEEQKIQREADIKAEQKLYLTGKFDPAITEHFVLIAPQYTLSKNEMYLREEAYEAYLKMQNAANKEGIDIKIASATRNFNYQTDLWNDEWSLSTIADGQKRFKKTLEYTATPGTSRHHWGTDIDINNANVAYFNIAEGKKVYEWLTKNANRFEFCQTYNKKSANRITGYNEEKWHWSYLPLARIFTEEYKNLIKDEDIRGFLGDKYSSGQDLITNYVLSINPKCI